MKHVLLVFSALLLAFSFQLKAQVRVNVNIGAQPVWGPVGYDYVEYYYMPDIDAYYDVPHRTYVYYDNGGWITRTALPPRYRTYDVYNGYKVVINDPTPWTHHDRYRTQYVQYKGKHGQPLIRDSRDERYYVNPRHPQHAHWKGGPARVKQVGPARHGNPHTIRHSGHHSNGHGNGHLKGNGKGHKGPGGNGGGRGNEGRGGGRGKN